MTRFLQSLMQLLPPGWAFPRGESVLMRTLTAFAQLLADRHAWVQRLVQQWMPHRTCSRVEEWEDALGLPDPCFGPDQDAEQRRNNMLARLRGDLALPYDDSSADSPGAIVAYLAQYGYQARAWYNWPFRVGRNRAGDRLGALNGILHIEVMTNSDARPFRVSQNRAGDRLRQTITAGIEIECLLRRIVPSRFAIHVIYS